MRFRILAPIVADRRYEPGEIVNMPASFIPSGACEPLDAQATQAFYAAGPQLTPLVKMQWSDIPMSTMPVTYWQPINAAQTQWQLTGLGSAMPPVPWTSQAEPGALP